MHQRAEIEQMTTTTSAHTGTVVPMSTYGGHIGDRIRGLREDRGLTQEELGARLGVPATTVSRWERGANQPRTRKVEKICEVLDVTVEELLGASPAPRRPTVIEPGTNPFQTLSREHRMLEERLDVLEGKIDVLLAMFDVSAESQTTAIVSSLDASIAEISLGEPRAAAPAQRRARGA